MCITHTTTYCHIKNDNDNDNDQHNCTQSNHDGTCRLLCHVDKYDIVEGKQETTREI